MGQEGKRQGEGQGEFQEQLLSVLWRRRVVPRVTALHLRASMLSHTCAKAPSICDHLDLGSACSRPHQAQPSSMARSPSFGFTSTHSRSFEANIEREGLDFYPFLPTMILGPSANLPSPFPATFELSVSRDTGRNRDELFSCPSTQIQVKRSQVLERRNCSDTVNQNS